MEKKKLIILTGPTAVGKTGLSIELARRYGCEIISADSMQVYRGMDIGTAKIKPQEMQGVTHHLIDIIEPDEEFNALIFKDLAKQKIAEITERGRIPMIVGGTGFYIQGVLYDVDFTEYSDAAQAVIRKRLEEELEHNGSLYMFEKLRAIDPVYADIIHPNNTKRLLHALEFYELTGKRMSEHNEEQHEKESPYDFIYIVLNDERDRVYANIDRRVDEMIDEGLVDEVRALRARGYTQQLPSMLGLGYKEIDDYLNGVIDLEEAVYLIKRDTRHFAKKQLTWFKREKSTLFVDKQPGESTSQLADRVGLIIDAHFSQKDW